MLRSRRFDDPIPDAAEKWFEDNDPIGVAFEYEVEGYPLGTAGTLAPSAPLSL
jgi:hypothetical protein